MLVSRLSRSYRFYSAVYCQNSSPMRTINESRASENEFTHCVDYLIKHTAVDYLIRRFFRQNKSNPFCNLITVLRI